MIIKITKEINKVQIGLISPREIQEWGEHSSIDGTIVGEVTNAKTVKTENNESIPEIGGIFCQKIFGPVKSYFCACGKKINNELQFCEVCGVERAHSRVRRHRFGHIKLKYPILHPLYATSKPSPLTFFLDWENTRIDHIISATEFCYMSLSFFNFCSWYEIIDSDFIKKIEKPESYIACIEQVKEKGKNENKSTTNENLPLTNPPDLFFSDSFEKVMQNYELVEVPQDFLMYGINYDMSWATTKNLSSFFYFFNSVPTYPAAFIPYYSFLKELKNYNLPYAVRNDSIFESSSNLMELYPIQTSGAAIEKILAFYDSNMIIKQLEFEYQHINYLLNQVKKQFDLDTYNHVLSHKIQTNQEQNEFEYDNDLNDNLNLIPSKNNFDDEIEKELKKQEELDEELDEKIHINDNDEQLNYDYYDILQNTENIDIFYDLKSEKNQYFNTDGGHDVLTYKIDSLFKSKNNNNYNSNFYKSLEKDQIEEDRLFFHIEWNFLKQLRKESLRKLEYFRRLYLNNMQPAWMVLSCLPVLPPDLRPVINIEDDSFMSDSNHLYQAVIIKNNQFLNITEFIEFDSSNFSMYWEILCSNIQYLQKAVNALIQTGELILPEHIFFKGSNEENKKKSLLDSLKGKKGRFRQHLLGKRVDYSGRSVIVVGPSLKIYECGLPLDMALELFQPFIIQKLSEMGMRLTTLKAKVYIAENKFKIWDILKEIMSGLPIILNRAPTLHRLGIQAFFPKLILEKTIRLHPLVCSAFNADFDGDQMAVHIPLTFSSQAETLQLIWSRNNILSPASGQPLLVPAQDMVLGCYFLTSSVSLTTFTPFFFKLKEYKIILKKKKIQTLRKNLNKLFSNYYKMLYKTSGDVKKAYEFGQIEIHTPIWLFLCKPFQTIGNIKESKLREVPIELQVDCFGNTFSIQTDRYKLITTKTYIYVRTTPGRLFFYELI